MGPIVVGKHLGVRIAGSAQPCFWPNVTGLVFRGQDHSPIKHRGYERYPKTLSSSNIQWFSGTDKYNQDQFEYYNLRIWVIGTGCGRLLSYKKGAI